MDPGIVHTLLRSGTARKKSVLHLDPLSCCYISRIRVSHVFPQHTFSLEQSGQGWEPDYQGLNTNCATCQAMGLGHATVLASL